MASSSEQANLAKGVMIYMGQLAEQKPKRHSKKLAKSPELKQFLIYLADKAPLVVNELMKTVSQKCEAKLRAERESGGTGKRAEPPDDHEMNPKRLKITRPTDEDAAPSERVTESDQLVQVRDHTRRFPGARVSRKDGRKGNENSDEEEVDAGPGESELSSVANKSARATQARGVILLPTPYQIEVGLPMGRPETEAHVKAHCLTLEPRTTRPNFDVHHEIADILNKSRLLEFYKVRGELQVYLEDRAKMPGRKLQDRTDWSMSNPGEILDALQTVKTTTFDAKIHRAYGQTKLFASVNQQVDEGHKSISTGHLFDHTGILEDIALKKAGPVSQSEKQRVLQSYLHEYHAGKKWAAVIDDFGGSGIALVFVTARIGTYCVEAGWTNFQRDCLQYIADLLPSVRRLVEALGSDALRVYCQHGCLDADCIRRVKESRFTQPDGDDAQRAGDEESEDESDGDDAQSVSDEEAENESGGDDA